MVKRPATRRAGASSRDLHRRQADAEVPLPVTRALDHFAPELLALLGDVLARHGECSLAQARLNHVVNSVLVVHHLCEGSDRVYDAVARDCVDPRWDVVAWNDLQPIE